MAEGRSLVGALELLGIPRSTFTAYRAKDSSRQAAFARARVDSCEPLEDAMIRTAQEAADGVRNPQGAKVYVDTLARIVAFRDPAKYGAKLEMTVNGNLSLRDALDKRPRLIGDSSTIADAQVIEHAPQSLALVPAPEPVTQTHAAQIEALLS